MPYVLVLLIAAAAGGGVAVATLRRGAVADANPEAWTKGYETSEEAPAGGVPTQAPGRSRSLPSAPTWQTRLTGIVGLLIAVLVGAGLIVGVCFAAWAAPAAGLRGLSQSNSGVTSRSSISRWPLSFPSSRRRPSRL